MVALLGACSKTENADTTAKDNKGEEKQQVEQQEDKEEDKEEEKEPEVAEETFDLDGRVIRFVTPNPNEDNPFHEEAPQTEETEERKSRHKAVEEKYNVKIEYVEYQKPEEERAEEIMTSVLAGEPIADIARVSAYYVSQLAAGDFLEPIDAYLEDVQVPDFALQVGSFEGKYFGFDTAFMGGDQGLFFNKRLVEEAGLENPTMVHKRGEWTFDKFLEYARELKNVLPEDVHPVSMDPAYFGLFIVGANGSSILDPDTNEVAFTRPESIEAIEYMQKFYQEGLVMPVPTDAEGEKSYWSGPRDAFKQGQSVFTHGHIWEAAYGYNNDLEDEWGYVPFPYGPNVKSDFSNYHTAVFDGGAKVMLKGSKDPEMVLRIWHDLMWLDHYPTLEEAKEEFALGNESIFPEEESIEAMNWAREHAYIERITMFRTADTSAYSFYGKSIRGIAEEGLSVRSTLESIENEVEAIVNQATGKQ